MSVEVATYLDSSALVKLIVTESETDALVSHLAGAARMTSSSLVEVEVVRAVRKGGAGLVADARRALDEIELIALDEPLLRAAADLADDALRTLDAIHVAAAQTLGDDLAEVITYDRRMIDAAGALGLPVVAPA
ncbi:MAG: PIN domain-containing protein [Thermoleophilaceae bacterium]